MIELTVIVAQTIVIIGLLVYNYVTVSRLTKLLEKSQMAVMSRNINDYLAAVTTTEKAKEPKTEAEMDEVFVDESDDSVFDRHIQEQNK